MNCKQVYAVHNCIDRNNTKHNTFNFGGQQLMARRFGKKNEVKIDPLKYNICLLGNLKLERQHLLKKYVKS